LFAALESYVPSGLLPSGVSFAQLMDTWTLQRGVPVLTVTRDYAGQTALVAQQRFGVDGAEQWIVPLTWTTEAQLDFDTQTPSAWLMTAETQLEVGVPPADQWLLLNVQQTAYYRVNYDQANWDMLFAFLEDPNTAGLIHPLNRAQILDDSFALAKFGHLPYTTALSSTKYLSHETTMGPWMAAIASLEFLRDRMYQNKDTEILFDRYNCPTTPQN
jgi:aminopeptidase N